MTIEELSVVLGENAETATQLAENYPLILELSVEELSQNFHTLIKAGVSPLDIHSLLWIVPSIFVVDPKKFILNIKKKQIQCILNKENFVEKIYSEPQFLLN